MEGTQGVTIELPIKPVPTAPKSAEQNFIEKPAQPVEPESLEKKSGDTPKEEKTRQSENNAEIKEESSQKDGEELDPLMEKKKEIETIFDLLGGKIGKELKEKIIDEYVNGFLEENEKAEKTTKMVESLTELTRVLKLIFTLIMLAVSNPKPTYSGKDLRLSDTAPEGETNEKINEALSGKSGSESWKNFKDEVEKIEELPFDKFMNEVLAANARHSITSYKPKGEEIGTKLLQNKKIVPSGKFGRNAGQMKPAAPTRG
jgi:hypothetical protein